MLIKIKFVVIILLIVANAFAFFHTKEVEVAEKKAVVAPLPVVKRPISPTIIDSVINATLHEFSIPDSFYVKSKKKKRIHKLLVPEDLPLPTIENALFNKLSGFEGKFKAGFNKKEKGTVFSIPFGDTLIYSVVIQKKKGFTRSSSVISIVISGYENASESIKKYLRDYPEPYVILLKPTKTVQVLSKAFDDQQLPYAILIGSDDADLEFRIAEDHPKRRIETTISGLIAAFPNAAFFYTEQTSQLGNSVIFPFVREKFEAKKRSFIKSNIFIPVTGADSTETLNSFQEVYSKNRNKHNIVFVLKPESIIWLEGEIKKLRKKGVKISGSFEVNSESTAAP